MSQNVYDAVRSHTQLVQGTSRFNAMGGSTSALGADFSHASVNPAGLGLFRSSELAISTGFNFHNATSKYNGSSGSATDVRWNLNSLSFVQSSLSEKSSGIIQYTWGIGYNRTNQFHQELAIQGENPGNSILDEMTYDLNVPTSIDTNLINVEPSLLYGPALAWNTFVIDFDSTVVGGGQYFHANPFYEGIQLYSQEVAGSTADYLVSGAINYENKLFIGGSLGFAFYRYSISSVYEEQIPSVNSRTDLNDFRYRQQIEISGSNTRFRVGVIYRFNETFRAGLAYHAGHTTRAEDRFEFQMNSSLGAGDLYESSALPGTWSYSMRSPSRIVASTGITLRKTFAFSFEYEYTDFSRIEFSHADGLYDYEFENQTINSDLKATHNLRAGAEFRKGMLTFRGGFRYYMSPFEDTRTYGNTLVYATGIGMRNGSVFFDVTYQLTTRQEQFWMFDPAFGTPADLRINSHSIQVSLGFRWK